MRATLRKQRKSKEIPRKILRSLRQTGRKTLLLLAGTALACAALETYLRLKWPFLTNKDSTHFHPKAGSIRKPNAEVRSSNNYGEFFTTQRVNSLGFLDREPPDLEQTRSGCHITIIGDSFVEARQVPIADKFHVQLERLAAKELPHLNITTSTFGRGGTGQINQLIYYDQFAQHLHPCILVLVFVVNDFGNNHPVLSSLQRAEAWDPEHAPFATVEKSAHDAWRLRPPDPDFRKRMLPRLPMSWTSRVRISSSQKFYLAKWLYSKRLLWKHARVETAKNGRKDPEDPQMTAWVELLSRRPHYASLAEEWTPKSRINSVFERENLPPVFKKAIKLTAYALDQFKKRAESDVASLLILSTHTMGTRGDRLFDRMNALAEERNIPVIDQTDYILRQGDRITDAHWRHDRHWNATGHQWAAEALLEYLKENQYIYCAQSGE